MTSEGGSKKPASAADVRVGKNVMRHRAERSQQELADAMRERGWKWSQATVWSVERGTRPLRYLEAIDLAEILGTEALVFAADAPTLIERTHAASRQIAKARDAASRAFTELLASLDTANQVLSDAEEEGVLPMGADERANEGALEPQALTQYHLGHLRALVDSSVEGVLSLAAEWHKADQAERERDDG